MAATFTGVPGYAELTDEQRSVLRNTYELHFEALEFDQRYLIGQVSHVEYDEDEQTVNIHFKNGDWWHYTKSRRWY